MVSYRTQGLSAMLLMGELVVATLAFWCAVLLWDTFSATVFDPRRFFVYNQLLVIGMLLGVGSRRFHSPAEVHRENSRQARRQTAGGLFAVALVAAASDEGRNYYGFVASFAPGLYVSLRLAKHYLPGCLGRLLFSEREVEPVLIIGKPDQVRRLAPWLRSREGIGLRPVGLLDDVSPHGAEAAAPVPVMAGVGEEWDRQGTEWTPRLPKSVLTPFRSRLGSTATGAGVSVERPADGIRDWVIPWLGRTAELNRVLEQQPIRQVLVVGLRWPEGFLRECITTCERGGVRLHVVSDLDEHFRHSVTLIEDGGVQLIGLREEPLESPLNRLLKRALDVVTALPVVLVVLPPVTLVVWMLHRWQSPGPVFFRQQRSGMHGRRFPMVKFRTMTVDNDDETRQVDRRDPRVFPAGYWMRRFSIDELPQFLNVLRGEMSVVGPRPHIPAHDDLFTDAMQNYRVRSAVKPGITGLAQVRGFRGGTPRQEDIVRRVSSDIEYLERWTLELDLWILFRTFWQVVFPPHTAY